MHSAKTVVQMLSELFIFVIIVNFTVKSYVTCVTPKDEIELDWKSNRIGRDESWSVLDSIKHIFGNIKSAFSSFYQELVKDKNMHKPNKLKQMKHNLTERYGSDKDYYAKPETSAEKMIITSGYRPQSHTVLTEDGYMLTMQRIVPATYKNNKKKRVVLLHHGLFGSSEDWLIIGKSRALPYMLTDNGFDVWLLNARGNKYSRVHTSKNVEMQEYWDFTFHEIALYDLPAVIKYIAEITDRAEIHYIGHSLGSTVLLVLLATIPEYNFVLKAGVLIAPLTFMYHAKGPIRMLADFYSKNGHNSIHFLGKTSFFPEGTFPEQITGKYCKGTVKTCLNPLLLLCDGGKESENENLIESILEHVPGGGSAKTLIHYVQLVRSGYFQNFDYGVADNYRKYGNANAPFYDLKRVTLPIALFSAPNDWLSAESDIQTLLPLLQDVHVHHVVNVEDFGHLDFLWSPIAPEVIYDLILTIFEKMLPHDDEFFEE